MKKNAKKRKKKLKPHRIHTYTRGMNKRTNNTNTSYYTNYTAYR